MLEKFVAEVFGTGTLILLGDGVVAGVLLTRSKAQNSGWIVITWAWALAVFCGVVVAGPVSGAHLNPAVTLAVAMNGGITWDQVPWYWAGEMLGAFLGAVLVYIHYLPHWAETENADLKLAVFSTGPAIRNYAANFISEVIGTFVLVGLCAALADGGAGAAEGIPAGPGHRSRPRWDNGLRDQPCSRSWAAHRALPSPDSGKARLGLELRLGSGGRTTGRRSPCGDRLPGGIHELHGQGDRQRVGRESRVSTE